jgi:hypothetical protein
MCCPHLWSNEVQLLLVMLLKQACFASQIYSCTHRTAHDMRLP